MDINVLIARIRIPLVLLGLALIAAGFVVDVVGAVGVVVLVAGMLCYFLLGRVRRVPTQVRLPVTGRWVALNSPANRVPSHGLHAWGQSYAIDLVHEPPDRPRPAFGSAPGFRRPEEFPAFGQPVLAPADGVVVAAHGRQRDHRSRSTWAAVLYGLVEGSVRELLGPRRILGNHVILNIGADVYAVLAHLRSGTVRVVPGDAVRAGDRVADCGNSGNSTEPHLHLQLMDHRNIAVAAGLPVEFHGFETNGEHRIGVPRNGEPFLAPS